MIHISIDGITAAHRHLRRVAEQMPDAAARILNYVGRDVRHALEEDIKARLDRPTPFTVKGIRSTTATPQKLYTDVGFKGDDLRAHYLKPQVYGGTREVKRFEWRLRQKGLLPAGMYVVPGAAARLDRYGNWSKGEMNQVLSALQAQGDTRANTDVNRSKGTRRGSRPKQYKRRVYWVGRPGAGRLPMGIWAIGEKIGKREDRVRPVAIFVRTPLYRIRWTMFATAFRVAGESLPRQTKAVLTQVTGPPSASVRG